MNNVKIFLTGCLLLCSTFLEAQKSKKPKSQRNYDTTGITSEVKTFFNEYGEDLRQHRREAIANRYDTEGYYRMGNGNKAFLSFEQSKNRYLNRWTGPKDFQWKNLSVEVLAPDAALVVGQFDMKFVSGDSATFSYSSILKNKNGQWRIRMEDESLSPPLGYTTQPISGSPDVAGTYKYSLTAQPGASISAHRHSADQHIKVISGRKFIFIGDLNTARVQIFAAGSSFVIPANTWHLEWWEEKTVENIEKVAPWRTEFATPATPRKQ